MSTAGKQKDPALLNSPAALRRPPRSHVDGRGGDQNSQSPTLANDPKEPSTPAKSTTPTKACRERRGGRGRASHSSRARGNDSRNGAEVRRQLKRTRRMEARQAGGRGSGWSGARGKQSEVPGTVPHSSAGAPPHLGPPYLFLGREVPRPTSPRRHFAIDLGRGTWFAVWEARSRVIRGYGAVESLL